MEQSLVRTGTFFSLAFALAGAYLVVSGFMLGKTVLQILTYSGFILCLVLSITMFVSSRVPRLRYIQPIGILLLTVASVITSPDPYNSTIYIGTTIILFYLSGFFEKRRMLKLILIIAGYYSLIVFQAFMCDLGGFFAQETRPSRGLGAVIPITIFLLFLYLAFKDRLIVYLKEPKQRLSLSEKGLSSLESSYLRRSILGKSAKEIAFEFEVSESTVRNTMTRGYKKLGVADKTEFAVLASESEIVE